ncbi:unnamed protein product [Cyclocybe aegerita]|uniref:Nudix hydrolase domain-containing protein n=1 Tax=Cyclocybe aegerita TaxID=1973307 RepID=A0A8S0WAE8_CYCAE|nr:unnamed protein product [Cyclocybe aegerita]
MAIQRQLHDQPLASADTPLASSILIFFTIETSAKHILGNMAHQDPISISESALPLNVPLAELRTQNQNKRLVAGVAIVAKSSPDSTAMKLLLIRRASTEDVYPLMYEIPGGGAEDEDDSIIATAVREVKEETGLTIVRILQSFEGFEYATRKGRAIQFNFMAEVEGGLDAEVKLNPSEHEDYAWVGPDDDLSKYPMTESMLTVVNNALAIIRNREHDPSTAA